MDFDVRILQRIPYEGASRLQTSIKRSFRERVVRRGIAMMVESDFYRTPQGIQYFLDQVKSIQYCVQETCNYDCMFALITCYQHDFHYDLRHSLVSNRNIMGALRHEIEMFAILNKEERGLDLAIEKTRQRLARYGVNPNLMITVPETMLYLNMVPESMRSYSERGERGPANFDSYNGAQLPPSFRGLSLYTSQPFDAGDDGKVQLLRRNTQIGEFYLMAPPPFWDSSSNNGALPATYMDVLIYDEEADRMVHIPFRDALTHACLPQVAAALDRQSTTLKDTLLLTNPARADVLNNMTVSVGGNKTKGEEEYANFVAAIDKIDAGTNVKGALDAIGAMVNNGIWIPLRIVITRPFIEHEMFSAIMMVSGADTGNTLLGPSDFQVSANTTVKTIEGHYTCHTKAVVTKPENVKVMRDVQFADYVAGSNCVWFGDIDAQEEDTTFMASTNKEELIKNDLRARLDFTREHNDQYASMLAFVAPYDDNPQYLSSRAFAISEQELPWEANARASQSRRNFPGGDLLWRAYKSVYGLAYVQAGLDPSSASNNNFVRSGTANNAVLIQGPYRHFAPYNKNTFFSLSPGHGHLGPDARPGDARVRRGQSTTFIEARKGVEDSSIIADSKFTRA